MSWLSNIFPKHTVLGKIMGSTNKSRGVHLTNLFTKKGLAEELKHMPENVKGVLGGVKAPVMDNKFGKEKSTASKGVKSTDKSTNYVTYGIYAVVAYFIAKYFKIL